MNIIKIYSIKKYLVCSLLFMLIACGGNIGKIEKYHFDTTEFSLKKAVKEVFLENPLMVKSDTTSSYSGGFENRNSYTVIKHENVYYVFSFCTFKESVNTSSLVLVSGAKYGEVMQFARDIDRKERRLYKRLFEELFIQKLEEKLYIEAYTKFLD